MKPPKVDRFTVHGSGLKAIRDGPSCQGRLGPGGAYFRKEENHGKEKGTRH
jgi:hypothetical protein